MTAFLVSDDWTHIFDDRRGEEHVRFAYDCEAGAIVAMDYRSSSNREWSPADPAQVADVTESLRGNYGLDPGSFGSGAFDDPAEFDIALVDALPAWVPAAGPAPRP